MTSNEHLTTMWWESVEAVREVRQEMVGTHGMKRWGLWQKKRQRGESARAAHLARMYAKGRQYREVERVTDEVHNPLYLSNVAALLGVSSSELEAWVREPLRRPVARPSEQVPEVVATPDDPPSFEIAFEVAS